MLNTVQLLLGRLEGRPHEAVGKFWVKFARDRDLKNFGFTKQTGNRIHVHFSNSSALLENYDEVAEFLSQCIVAESAIKVCRYLKIHKAIIKRDLTGMVLCQKIVHQFYKTQSQILTVEMVSETQKLLQDARKALKEGLHFVGMLLAPLPEQNPENFPSEDSKNLRSMIKTLLKDHQSDYISEVTKICSSGLDKYAQLMRPEEFTNIDGWNVKGKIRTNNVRIEGCFGVLKEK